MVSAYVTQGHLSAMMRLQRSKRAVNCRFVKQTAVTHHGFQMDDVLLIVHNKEMTSVCLEMLIILIMKIVIPYYI